MRMDIQKYVSDKYTSLTDLFLSLSESEQKALLSRVYDEGIIELYNKHVRI